VQERLLRRVSELEVTTREQQQQISALVDDLRQAEKKASETQKTLKDSAHAAQEAQTEAQLEIRKLRERLQTRESVPRTSSSIYSSARSDGVLAHPVADNSELARVQGLLELETLARAQAEAEAYDLEARLNDLQRAFSRRYPSIDGDNHEPADEGGGGLKELRDQVAHLQNRLAHAEATTDAHLRGQESEARRKTILLEQQVPMPCCGPTLWLALDTSVLSRVRCQNTRAHAHTHTHAPIAPSGDAHKSNTVPWEHPVVHPYTMISESHRRDRC
jgi:hypothetical protein